MEQATNISDEHIFKSEVHLWLGRVTTGPVSFLGIVGNVVCWAVWGMETSFTPSVYLFRYLAVLDNVFLLTIILGTLTNQIYKYIFITCVLLIQENIVGVTLMIAIIRWVAVVFPLRAARFFNAYRVYLSCFFIFLVSVILFTSNLLCYHKVIG